MKLKNNKNIKGFTLAEFLVVVAIIAVLVAVSIPVFADRTEKAREAADVANVRSAKAAYTAAYTSDDLTGDMYYNAASGKLQESRNNISGYGKGTSAGTDKTSHAGQILKCSNSNSTVNIEWVNGALDDSVTINGADPFLYIEKLVNDDQTLKSALAVKDSSIDSTASANTNTQKLSKALGSIFPKTNIASWRVTNESGTYTVTVTDVDISKLKNGDSVKVIRYNPKKGTYTAAYVYVRTVNDVNTLYVQSNLNVKYGTGWTEIGDQTATKQSYQETALIYNSAPDIIPKP